MNILHLVTKVSYTNLDTRPEAPNMIEIIKQFGFDNYLYFILNNTATYRSVCKLSVVIKRDIHAQ